jgi:hypothetical protein
MQNFEKELAATDSRNVRLRGWRKAYLYNTFTITNVYFTGGCPVEPQYTGEADTREIRCGEYIVPASRG